MQHEGGGGRAGMESGSTEPRALPPASYLVTSHARECITSTTSKSPSLLFRSRDGQNQSLDILRRTIAGYALMHALTVDRMFVERGIAGSSPLREIDRAARDAPFMIAGVARGGFPRAIVAHRAFDGEHAAVVVGYNHVEWLGRIRIGHGDPMPRHVSR